MKERFPDKKERRIEFSQATKYLEDGRVLFKEFDIGQKEALWIPRAEFDNLPIGVLLMTDTHFGSVKVDTGLLNEHLDIVEGQSNFFMVHNGDHTDNFNAYRFASGMSENPIPPYMQARIWSMRMVEMDRKSKVGALGFGNHDDWMFDTSQMDYYDSFFAQIQAPILNQGGRLTILLGNQTYHLAMAHRYWGTSKLNPTNVCKRYLEHEYPEADIVFIGHTHQSEGLHFERGGKDRIGVIGGTYKDRDTWARKQGIGGRSGSPGWMLMLWPNERRMQLFKDVKIAQEYMQNMIAGYETTFGDSYQRLG